MESPTNDNFSNEQELLEKKARELLIERGYREKPENPQDTCESNLVVSTEKKSITIKIKIH